LSRVDHTTPAPTRACLNCGTLLNGPFCAECGQRDIPPYPSARELVVDAVSELSGWDGRIATSVRTLLLRPGKLTREFLEGRRARYISPLRLYLMASLAYFVLAATAPDVRLDSGKTLFLGLRVSTTVANDSAASRPERVGAAARSAMESQQIASAPPLMQPFLRKSVDDPAGFRAGIFAAVPRMMFVLLPVFAGILALFYRGRKYPEHLYFAIHLHAFFFLVFAIVELLKFTQVAPLVIVGAALSTLSLPVYATVAFRHTYGGSLARTVAKEVGIGAIYAVVAATAFIVTIYVVSVAG
jgi:hypothetical protein